MTLLRVSELWSLSKDWQFLFTNKWPRILSKVLRRHCQSTIQRMESCENSECLWENSKNERVLWPPCLQDTDLFLECAFMVLPSTVDRSEFIWLLFICLYRKACFCHVWLLLVIEHLTFWFSLTLREKNCPML